jgi:hypothetical protein
VGRGARTDRSVRSMGLSALNASRFTSNGLCGVGMMFIWHANRRPSALQIARTPGSGFAATRVIAAERCHPTDRERMGSPTP